MTLQRAISFLEIKAIDEEKREIRGIATTPTPDRVGDIVEPKGAQFQLPIPLLRQHDHTQPVGHVVSAKVTAKGIEVVAKFVRIDEEGELKNRLDMAWQEVKSGLVRGFSIGFKPLEHARMDEGYGVRFLKWLWLELSTVTVPANGDCSITAMKTIDRSHRASAGLPVVSLVPAPAQAPSPPQSRGAVKLLPKGDTQ